MSYIHSYLSLHLKNSTLIRRLLTATSWWLVSISTTYLELGLGDDYDDDDDDDNHDVGDDNHDDDDDDDNHDDDDDIDNDNDGNIDDNDDIDDDDSYDVMMSFWW